MFFFFSSRVVYMSACCPQQDVFELDSTTQQLRHWNCLFLASHREHSIPYGAKCYHIKLSRVIGRPSTLLHKKHTSAGLKRSQFRSLNTSSGWIYFSVAEIPGAVHINNSRAFRMPKLCEV
jgi:hypothetical protein